MWFQIILALKMEAGGSFETFYLYAKLDGVAMHKTVCFILRIVLPIVIHWELLLDTLQII